MNNTFVIPEEILDLAGEYLEKNYIPEPVVLFGNTALPENPEGRSETSNVTDKLTRCLKHSEKAADLTEAAGITYKEASPVESLEVCDESICYCKSMPGFYASEPESFDDLDDILNKPFDTYRDLLNKYMNKYDLTPADLYTASNIDRRLFSKLMHPNYHPKKETLMALSIGLKLNFDEAEDLLASAGYTFSFSSKTDLIVRFAIENKIYDIYTVDGIMYDKTGSTLTFYPK